MSKKSDINRSKKQFRNMVSRYGSDWLETQVVFLGDSSGQVLTDKPGIYNAMQQNKKPIPVYNAVNVPAKPNLQVLVGRKKSQPHRWQIIEDRDAYINITGIGGVASHYKQHMLEGWDRLPVDRKQIIQFTVQVFDAAGFIVAVNGGVTPTATAIRRIKTTFLDLSSYVITSGAKYVSIELADDGTLSLHDGTVFGSLLAASDTYIPVPDSGKYMIAFVLLHESQEELSDADICVPMPLPLVSRGAGFDIHSAEEETVLVGTDEIGFWSVVDGELKRITWANFFIFLATLFSEVDHEHVGGSGAELLMEDGVTFPPVPLTNETGDDWMYDN